VAAIKVADFGVGVGELRVQACFAHTLVSGLAIVRPARPGPAVF